MSSRWRLLASGNPSKTPRQFGSETYLSGGDGYEPSPRASNPHPYWLFMARLNRALPGPIYEMT
jgi:hypothetical protein